MNETRVGIIDIDMGNLRSVSNAVWSLGFDFELLDSPDRIDSVTHLILPGVGAFHVAMRRLVERGLDGAITRFAAEGRPVAGICLGMQVLGSRGDEGEPTEGLGIIPGIVHRFEPGRVPTIPHVGWNSIAERGPHPVLAGVRTGVDFYFVHSYYLSPDSDADVLATTDYGGEFASIAGHGSAVGFQFHPEKSQTNGLRLLENFCGWDGRC